MPGFVQAMKRRTSRIEEAEAPSRQMQQERGNALLAPKGTITQDRGRPGHCFVPVESGGIERIAADAGVPAGALVRGWVLAGLAAGHAASPRGAIEHRAAGAETLASSWRGSEAEQHRDDAP